MLHDVRYALRLFRRRPGVTALILFTLAIGIAASTSVFSVADAILWHPLPFRHPERLVSLWSFEPERKIARPAVRLASLSTWDTKSRLFDGVHAYSMGGFIVTGDADAQSVTGGVVSEGLFAELEPRPRFGRDFATDDFHPSSEPVVILSDALWRTRFGRDAAVVGRAITIDNRRHTVIGVMPSGFVFPVDSVQFWIPLVGDLDGRSWVNAVARLRADVSFNASQAAAEATTHDLRDTSGAKLPELRIRPFTRQVPQTATTLFVLGGAVALMLLIAVANTANVLLAEAVRRDGEMATRAALGASAMRLAKQIIAETLVVAVAACALGVGLAVAILEAVTAGLPRVMTFQTLRPIAIDWRALTFAVVVSVAGACGAALAPLARARRATNGAARRAGVGGTGHARIRAALVVVQLAVTLVLLAGAGLLARGFVRLQRSDVGYDPSHLLSISVHLSQTQFRTNSDRRLFLEHWRQAVAVLPGVRAATIAEAIPPQLGFTSGPVETSDGRVIGDVSLTVTQAIVDEQFFATLRIPVLKGRSFSASSGTDEPRPVVVSRSFADAVWPRQDPLGREYKVARTDRWYAVVGVAGDVKNGPFEQPLGGLAMYEPRSPRSDIWKFQSLIVRAGSPVPTVERAVRDAVRRLNANVAVTEVKTADALIAGVNARVRFASALMAVFATVATLLALVGVYGAFWCAVSQRTREIGVRLALGAAPGDIVRMVLVSSSRVALVGAAIGLAVALASTRVLQTLLFEVSPTDPATLTAVTALLIAVALAASFVPARRASRINPSVTFRTE